MDEPCLRRSLAEIGVALGLWAGILEEAVALDANGEAAKVRRQLEFTLVARGERYCSACNVDFDRDFLDARAMSGCVRQSCARCNAPTALGQVDNLSLNTESEWVEFQDEIGDTQGHWRYCTPEPNKACLHVVGGNVYCYNGRRVTACDEVNRFC